MSESPKYLDESLSFAERAKDLVSRMTLEEKASQMVYTAPAIPRLGIPAYNWWNEALHGVARAGTATMFPQAIAMAAMFDADMVEHIGSIIAEEGRAKYNEYSRQNDRDIYKGLTFSRAYRATTRSISRRPPAPSILPCIPARNPCATNLTRWFPSRISTIPIFPPLRHWSRKRRSKASWALTTASMASPPAPTIC